MILRRGAGQVHREGAGREADRDGVAIARHGTLAVRVRVPVVEQLGGGIDEVGDLPGVADRVFTALHVVEHANVLELTRGPMAEEDQEVGAGDARGPVEDRVDDQAATVLIAVEVERPGLVREVDRAAHRTGAREDGRGAEVHDARGRTGRGRRLSTVHAGVAGRRHRGVHSRVRGRRDAEGERDVGIALRSPHLAAVAGAGDLVEEDQDKVNDVVSIVDAFAGGEATHVEHRQTVIDLDALEFTVLVEDVDDVLSIAHLFDAGERHGRAVRGVLDRDVQGGGEGAGRGRQGQGARAVTVDDGAGIGDPGELARDGPPREDGLRWLGHRTVLLDRRSGVLLSSTTGRDAIANRGFATVVIATGLVGVAVGLGRASTLATAHEKEAAEQRQQHENELHSSLHFHFSSCLAKITRLYSISENKPDRSPFNNPTHVGSEAKVSYDGLLDVLRHSKHPPRSKE